MFYLRSFRKKRVKDRRDKICQNLSYRLRSARGYPFEPKNRAINRILLNLNVVQFKSQLSVNQNSKVSSNKQAAKDDMLTSCPTGQGKRTESKAIVAGPRGDSKILQKC